MNDKTKEQDLKKENEALAKKVAENDSEIELNKKKIAELEAKLSEPADDSKLAAMEADNKKLMDRIEELQAAANTQESNEDQEKLKLREQVVDLNSKISNLESTNEGLMTTLNAKDENRSTEMASLQAKVQELTGKLAGYDEVVRARDVALREVASMRVVHIPSTTQEPVQLPSNWTQNLALKSSCRYLIDVDGASEKGVVELIGPNTPGSRSKYLYTAPGQDKAVLLENVMITRRDDSKDGQAAYSIVLTPTG